MAPQGFFDPAAKEVVRQAVVDIESRTSAEIVVAVRRAAGRYREADYVGGLAIGLLVLLGLLYLPPVFPLWTFVPNVALGFAIGTLLASRSAWWRRHLTPGGVLADHTRAAARATFVDGDYSRLPARTAVLVYVAVLERQVEIVADVGVREATQRAEWWVACRELEASLRPPDVDRFVAALRQLGQPLAAACPRATDDRNELPDEADLL